MLFGIRLAGSTDSTEAIVAVHGGMLVLLRLLGELSEGQPPMARPDRLVDELVQWSARRDDDGSSSLALRLGVLTWTRMHGIVSLELAEVFASWASSRSCSSRPRPRRSSMRPRSEQIAPSASVSV